MKKQVDTLLPPGPVVVDVQGYTLTDHERQRLSHPLVGGVILFTRNFESREQLTGLCAEIHAARSEPLLIAVDHEGGRVQRFRADGFSLIPAMQQLGQLWEANPQLAINCATDAGYILAAELRACGIDLSFTPVLDLDYGVSEVIGTRSFHRNPEVVTTLARALIHGLALAGMAACGKHFPGHGAVAADSHHEIPVDTRNKDTIMLADAAPYAWLGDLTLPSIMPAHVIFPEVDQHPAGFSKVWIQQILRTELSYDGVVFSDDLSMEGATVAGDIHDRAMAALQAGCDMVLVCNSPDLADQLLERLQWQSSSRSISRIQSLMPVGKPHTWLSLQTENRYQNARTRLQSNKLLG